MEISNLKSLRGANRFESMLPRRTSTWLRPMVVYTYDARVAWSAPHFLLAEADKRQKHQLLH